MTDSPPVVQRQQDKCFLVICRDGADSAVFRKQHLEGHLSHVEKHWRSYVTAGPTRTPGQDEITGSVFLVLSKNLDTAKALMNGDPYITSGMYKTIEYLDFTNSIGLFPGGKIWESVEAIRHK